MAYDCRCILGMKRRVIGREYTCRSGELYVWKKINGIEHINLLSTSHT